MTEESEGIITTKYLKMMRNDHLTEFTITIGKGAFTIAGNDYVYICDSMTIADGLMEALIGISGHRIGKQNLKEK